MNMWLGLSIGLVVITWALLLRKRKVPLPIPSYFLGGLEGHSTFLGLQRIPWILTLLLCLSFIGTYFLYHPDLLDKITHQPDQTEPQNSYEVKRILWIDPTFSSQRSLDENQITLESLQKELKHPVDLLLKTNFNGNELLYSIQKLSELDVHKIYRYGEGNSYFPLDKPLEKSLLKKLMPSPQWKLIAVTDGQRNTLQNLQNVQEIFQSVEIHLIPRPKSLQGKIAKMDIKLHPEYQQIHERIQEARGPYLTEEVFPTGEKIISINASLNKPSFTICEKNWGPIEINPWRDFIRFLSFYSFDFKGQDCFLKENAPPKIRPYSTWVIPLNPEQKNIVLLHHILPKPETFHEKDHRIYMSLKDEEIKTLALYENKQFTYFEKIDFPPQKENPSYHLNLYKVPKEPIYAMNFNLNSVSLDIIENWVDIWSVLQYPKGYQGIIFHTELEEEPVQLKPNVTAGLYEKEEKIHIFTIPIEERMEDFLSLKEAQKLFSQKKPLKDPDRIWDKMLLLASLTSFFWMMFWVRRRKILISLCLFMMGRSLSLYAQDIYQCQGNLNGYPYFKDQVLRRGTIPLNKLIPECKEGQGLWWTEGEIPLVRHIDKGGLIVMEGIHAPPKALENRSFRWEKVNSNHGLLRSFYLLKELEGCSGPGETWVLNFSKENTSPIPMGIATKVKLLSERSCSYPEMPYRSFMNILYLLFTLNYKTDQSQLPDLLKRLQRFGLEP